MSWAHDDLINETGPGTQYSRLPPEQKMDHCKIRRKQQIERWCKYDKECNYSLITNKILTQNFDTPNSNFINYIDQYNYETLTDVNTNPKFLENLSPVNAFQIETHFKYHKPRRKTKPKTDKILDAISSSRNGIAFLPNVALLDAVNRSDIKEVEYLLSIGADPNAADEDGLTALHQACIDNCEEIVKILLKNGSHVDCRDTEDWTPLHACTTCGHQNIAQILLDYGADILALNADLSMAYDICEDGSQMLEFIEHAMEQRNITQEQINKIRAQPEQRIIDDIKKMLHGDSFYDSGINNGDYEPFVKTSDDSIKYPELGIPEITSLKTNSTDHNYNCKQQKSNSPYNEYPEKSTTDNSFNDNKHTLAISKSFDIKRQVKGNSFCNLANGNYFDNKPVQINQKILSNNQIPNQFTINQPLPNSPEQYTLLHVAAANGYITLAQFILESCHANPNVRDIDGWTPLHAACCWCQKEIIQLLVEYGADLNIPNCSGERPIDVVDEQDIAIYLEQIIVSSQEISENTNDTLNNPNYYVKAKDFKEPIERPSSYNMEIIYNQNNTFDKNELENDRSNCKGVIKKQSFTQKEIRDESQKRHFETKLKQDSIRNTQKSPKQQLSSASAMELSSSFYANSSFNRSTGSRRSARSQSFRRRSVRKNKHSVLGRALSQNGGIVKNMGIDNPVFDNENMTISQDQTRDYSPAPHETEAKREAAFWRGDYTNNIYDDKKAVIEDSNFIPRNKSEMRSSSTTVITNPTYINSFNEINTKSNTNNLKQQRHSFTESSLTKNPHTGAVQNNPPKYSINTQNITRSNSRSNLGNSKQNFQMNYINLPNGSISRTNSMIPDNKKVKNNSSSPCCIIL